ncbi:dTDP-4-dehydrorhamnose reductase [Cardinium endosymbiont of Sogatella furcifera]|uniref:dTDP-4-dehydrorhamnose reductase n=1 Tax=Cardinium endosymbiont of Sogatella furcifera TaxID=650378 RepID=UPI000E0DFFF6|nr:dTDP-4-dehydrorhamnose reductase [Cardinium endosymbiont of Sogatella furcifera]AXI24424.1 dTDP-4-dehydrorhamnose reductase [Cardinium endosymbiont of Sogatella furcifera]
MVHSVVLVTGAEGQLGAALRDTFKAHAFLLPRFCSKAMLDITDAAQIESCIKADRVQYIINCAAYTHVALAEQVAANCFKVNSIGAGYLATLAAKYRIVLLHISTDYVFGATIGRPLKPNDPTDPWNQYGRSKLAGEQLIAARASHFYIIRTAWLYGEKGNNFFTKMVALAQKERTIHVVDDQIGTPTYVYDLATAIWGIIENMANNRHYPSGIYHYTNEGVASWYDFAYAILTALPHRCAVEPCASSLAHLTRPYYSVLSKASFREVFQMKIPHWRHSLSICLKRWQDALP